MSSPSLIPPQRDRFELPRETCYLSAAYMGPMPKTAIAAGQHVFALPEGRGVSRFEPAEIDREFRAAEHAEDDVVIPRAGVVVGIRRGEGGRDDRTGRHHR